jgi:hypothetical protein
MSSKLDWNNTDASNMPDYASEAFGMLVDAMTIFEKAWADHAPVGKRPVFAYRKDAKGQLSVGVALANGTSRKETLAQWLDRNKFSS